MIRSVLISLPDGAPCMIYRVIYASGRDVLIPSSKAPSTVRKFLMDHANTARTLRVPHLTDACDIAYTYYVIYTRF